jgi:hypothetical protein
MVDQILGNYSERSNACEYLTLAFSPGGAPLRSRWRNNGLSADFLGDYVITFLPGDSGMGAAENRRSQLKHAVTYVANELLENAMKYHERHVDVPIGIHLELTSNHITVSVSNGIGAGQAQLYRAFVENLLKGNAADLLLRKQEEAAECKDSAISCLGLLTMVNDYDAQLGWRFTAHPAHSEIVTVTTSVVLALTTPRERPHEKH